MCAEWIKKIPYDGQRIEWNQLSNGWTDGRRGRCGRVCITSRIHDVPSVHSVRSADAQNLSSKRVSGDKRSKNNRSPYYILLSPFSPSYYQCCQPTIPGSRRWKATVSLHPANRSANGTRNLILQAVLRLFSNFTKSDTSDSRWGFDEVVRFYTEHWTSKFQTWYVHVNAS